MSSETAKRVMRGVAAGVAQKANQELVSKAVSFADVTDEQRVWIERLVRVAAPAMLSVGVDMFGAMGVGIPEGGTKAVQAGANMALEGEATVVASEVMEHLAGPIQALLSSYAKAGVLTDEEVAKVTPTQVKKTI